MLDLPIPSRSLSEAHAHDAYAKAIANLDPDVRDPIVTFVNALMDDADERHDTIRRVQLRNDDPIAVEATMVTDQIAYIDVRSCDERTPAQFTAVLDEVLKLRPSGLILDLRSNIGGASKVAAAIAGHFLPAKTVVARFVPTTTIEVDPAKLDLTTSGEPDVPTLPLAVMVDRWSASTSEIVAAALQFYGRATLLGEPSFGKPHATLTLRSGETITPGTYARPDGSRFDEDGVQPDVSTGDPLGDAIGVLTDAS